MAECPGGRTNRGTRSQFRLGTPALGLFKGLHPIHLGDIMDVKQSSQTGVLSARDLVSPSKGTRTLTVREYEQTIDELKKENFDLKLRLHLLEESMKKFSSKDKDGCSPDKNTVQIVVQLKLETESLRKDLAYKEKVLQDALEQVEKYKLDFKELEEKYAELQNDLSSLSELPSKQEFLSVLEEKENLLRQTELFEQTLTEKDQEIHNINEKIEILANQNTLLEEKIKKRSLAIQGFVYKNFKEKEMFPDELRNVVLSATQAAKNQNKENLAVAVKSFNSVLNQIMSSSVQKMALNESEEKENIRSPQAKCLEEESLEKSNTFLPSQIGSFTELNRIQSLKEVLHERNIPECKQFHSLDSAVHDLYMKRKLNESSVNVPEKDILECIDFSAIPLTSVAEENLLLSDRHSGQLCPGGKNNLIEIESVSSPLVSSDVIHEDEGLSKNGASLLSGTAKEINQLMRENEKLKLEVKDKLAVIQDLKATCEELEQKGTHLQENDALKASKCYSVYTQTDMAGSNILNEHELTRLQIDAKLSTNVEELREDVLLLLLAMEDKNKELGDVKQTLSAVQEDLNRALNTSSNVLDKEYINERNELHERLAFSCSVNIELMKHLRNLETFMEDLLQHKFDSSMESIGEKSDFLSNVSKCLNESLKLSNVLSDHLSICEGSKLFEDCESVFYKSASYSDDKSLPNMNLSEMNVPDQHSSSYTGTQRLEEYIPFVRKSDERMGKELDGSQLCWRCWQQLNSSLLNKFEFSHLIQNNVSPKCLPYPSSDSDIWSEPDRNVSMQRIGISLQNSPVASKSPRKLRFKEKRMSNKLSSDMNTSSSEMQRWSKQRRHGSVSRRLFGRDSIKTLDFTSEKFYFLLAEKYSKLKTLLEALENLKDSGVSDEVWIKMNAVVACLGEALQKLHIAKENGKNLPSAICGKCIMLELFMDLKASHKADFCIDDVSSENEILQQFQREVHLLKEACKEPFSLFPESTDQRSQAAQSDSASDDEQVKISELEDAIVDLNDKNKNLNKSLEDVKQLLSEEKELSESLKLEKVELSKEISSLIQELSDVKQKENKSYLKNEELVRELEKFQANSSKFNSTLEDLDKEKSSTILDELTAELQKNKLDLNNMKVKCVEYEKQLEEQIQLKQEFEEKLRNLESTSLSEKEAFNSNIRDLNSEKHNYQKDLESIENRKLALEKQNASLNANLKSRCSEISSLQETINMLQACKKPSSLFLEAIDKRSQSTQSDSAYDNEEVKISELEDAVVDVNDKNKRLNKSLEETKRLLFKERELLESVKSENLELSNQINNLREELLVMKQKEKELSSKNEELIKELSSVNRNNAELNSTLKDLEEKRKESSVALNQLAAELEKNKLDLVSMNKKCLDYEKQLNEHLQVKEEYEMKLRNLESTPVSEKEILNNDIRDLNSQKSHYQTELESVEKETAALSDNLKSKHHEFSSSQDAMNVLQACKKSSFISPEGVDKRSQSIQSESAFASEQVKISELEDAIVDLKDNNKNLNKSLEDVKMLLSKEKKKLESVKAENWELCSQVNNLKEELLTKKQREKEISIRNEELVEDVMSMNKNNTELNFTLKDLEEKKKASSAALDQLTADLQKNKLDLVNMNVKCLEYEKELNEQKWIKEEYEKKLRNLESSSCIEKETLFKNINHLNSEKCYYQKELKSMENEKLALEKENAALRANFKSKCNELSSLQENIHMLQQAKETLSYNCRDLQSELENTKKDFQSLQERCSMYEEEVLKKFKANDEEYCRQLKQLETESLRVKEKLLMQISELTLEREAILKKLNTENKHYEKLMAEKNELNQNFAESCEQISSLKLLNEELKNRQQSLLQRNEFFEKALLSSNSECNSLSNDLKRMRETLQNLESKCAMYERELAATAGMKDSLVECLLNINSEFSTNRQKLNEMCKVYGSGNRVDYDETAVPQFIPVIDEDNVKKLCENLCFESKRLLQSVDMLLELLKSFHLKASETKTAEEKFNLKTSSITKEMEYHKAESKHLKSQNDHLQQVMDELQKSISEKEKSIQQCAYEIQSLKEKIHKSEEEIEKGNQLLKKKDDEITMLQERVFNLQSYVNTIMADKTNIQDNILNKVEKFVDDKADSVSSASQLPSKLNLKQDSKAVQTKEFDDPSQSTDELSLLESGKRSCCEKYVKKYHSLQTKLTLFKKHNEILEKEKNDLKERYLSQLQSKKSTSSLEKGESSIDTKLVDLESKLDQKKAFISELKAELLKTCNSLIDKEKEVDDLREKLSEYEKKSTCKALDTSDHSIGSPKTVNANIRSLRNYKWKLIQTIFDIQRKFYEKKGIHLNYFDRFKDHVNNLYTMQLTHSLSKSESMPLLGSHSLKQLSNQAEDKMKNLVGLELDIECLENLKIFLNRFFVPCLLQTSQNFDVKSSDLESVEKRLSSDELLLDAKIGKENSSKIERISFIGISLPECVTDHLLPEHVQSSQKTLSFENFASKVSHHLDCIENFFTAVRKCQWLESSDFSAEESVDMAEAKSLLFKIFEEIKALQEGADKLFGSNALLKNFDFIAQPLPLSFSRPDVSDKESVMSEETIGISRSESPLSFEELCPVKLPSPETLTLEEKTIKPKSLSGKVTITEPYNAKVTAIGSSCDSVCQRSHYSSPDLGIESDPNHESSAPEQKEEGINKYQMIIMDDKKFILKPQQKTAFTSTESAGRFTGMKFGEDLYSIGKLPHYELLKREIQESLVGIKSVLSRTGDGLHHVAKYTSPRKTLEYSTLKAIKDSCANIEVCLKEAYTLIGKFWIAPCPSEKEWKALIEENQGLIEQLVNLRSMTQKQEGEFKKAMGRLEHAQLLKANMEKKISKKLVKTKKVIRQAELKLLENRCQNLRPVPKYPSDQANLGQQKENV